MTDWRESQANFPVLPYSMKDEPEDVPEVEVEYGNNRNGEMLHNSSNKRSRTTSDCWDHFTKITVLGIKKAKCIHCGAELTAGSGTSHLNRHVRSCLSRTQQKDQVDDCLEKKEVTKDDGTCGVALQSFDPIVASHKLATLIVKHELPLRFVEYDAFKDLMSYCNPLAKNMCRSTLKIEIFKLYNSEKAKTMKLLENNDSRVAITTDLWTTSNQKKGYMVVTGHFVDNSWRLQSRILRFINVPAPHTVECLSQVLVKCLWDWDVDKKLSTITLDSCTTNEAMVDRVKGMIPTESMVLNGKFFHMRCAAHILNLIVKDGLKVIEGGIGKIRESVSYWSSSPKRLKTFEMTAHQLQIVCERKLVLDCPTRWNSTFDMLDVAVMYKNVFSRLQHCESHYKCLPSDKEWELAEKMLDYLRPFYSLTDVFSGTAYPTAIMFFPVICKMRKSLMEWQMSPIPEVKLMADGMIEKFLKYWQEIHMVLVMAVILDPRFKMLMIEFYFPKIYAVGVVEQIKRVRDLCEEIFNYYEVTSTALTCGAVAESSLAVGHSLKDQRQLGFLNWAAFEAFASQNTKLTKSQSELERYLEEPLVERTADFDVLTWWKMNKDRYPVLAEIAKDILAIPVTTVASKSAFSVEGRSLSPHRSRLHPDTLEAIMCTQHWLWAADCGAIPEEEIFSGEELNDDEDNGPQILN